MSVTKELLFDYKKSEDGLSRSLPALKIDVDSPPDEEEIIRQSMLQVSKQVAIHQALHHHSALIMFKMLLEKMTLDEIRALNVAGIAAQEALKPLHRSVGFNIGSK